jgi:hypothetical protein
MLSRDVLFRLEVLSTTRELDRVDLLCGVVSLMGSFHQDNRVREGKRVVEIFARGPLSYLVCCQVGRLAKRLRCRGVSVEIWDRDSCQLIARRQLT